jgi:hypothetical protein
MRGHPSTHADLHHYGAGFASSLRDCETLAGLPYLPDVARLEWLAHEAFHAADAHALAAASLAEVPQDRLADLRLCLHPSVRLMRSDYPVHRVWQVNQPHWSGDQMVDLDWGGVSLAVFRDGLEIALLPLDAAAYALAVALQAGQCLGDALDHALAVGPEDDPALALHTLFHHRLVAEGSPLLIRPKYV